MPARSSKSVLRTLRIPSAMDAVLQRDSEEKGISVNALVSAMITKYAEWDRFAERFGMVTTTRAGHVTLMDVVPEPELLRHAEEAGSRNAKEMTLFWFKKLDLESFLAYLRIVCRYGGILEMEVEREGRSAVVSLHHEMGPKFTRWLRAFMTAATREVVGVAPKIRAGHSSIIFRIDPP